MWFITFLVCASLWCVCYMIKAVQAIVVGNIVVCIIVNVLTHCAFLHCMGFESHMAGHAEWINSGTWVLQIWTGL